MSHSHTYSSWICFITTYFFLLIVAIYLSQVCNCYIEKTHQQYSYWFQGTTKTYTKYGHFRQEFRSALPGGNPCDPTKNRCCVLDCFYSDQNKVMYVLDLLAWNNQPMTDGEVIIALHLAIYLLNKLYVKINSLDNFNFHYIIKIYLLFFLNT